MPGGVELASIYHFMHSLSEFWDIAEVLRENWENWTLKKVRGWSFFWIFLIGGLNILHWEAFKAICRMAYFDLSSESHFEVRSFLTRITCSLLVQYSRNELPNTWFWQFFLKKIISRAEFDELCYFGTQNPWNFGENCKRIGLNSKNLSLKLIITDDI